LCTTTFWFCTYRKPNFVYWWIA